MFFFWERNSPFCSLFLKNLMGLKRTNPATTTVVLIPRMLLQARDHWILWLPWDKDKIHNNSKMTKWCDSGCRRNSSSWRPECPRGSSFLESPVNQKSNILISDTLFQRIRISFAADSRVMTSLTVYVYISWLWFTQNSMLY